MTNGNDLANALHVQDLNDRAFEPMIHLGLTKREYFAAMAMQGICARGLYIHNDQIDKYAIAAVKLAESLINVLNKQQ